MAHQQYDFATQTRALEELGVTQDDFARIQRTPFPASKTLLEELKDRAKTNYRKVASNLHPDRHQGAPPEEREAKEKWFKVINHFYAELNKLEIAPAPPPRPVIPMAVPFPFPVVINTGTGSATTGFGSPGAPFVVIHFGPQVPFRR